MRTRYVGLGAVIALLLASSAGFVVAGSQQFAAYQRAYATYKIAATGPCGALITWSPPTTVYAGLYINQPSFLSLRYRSADPETLRLSISIEQFTQDQTVQVQAAPAFQQYPFKPPLIGSSALSLFAGSDSFATQIRLRVQSPGGTICDTTAPVTVKSPEWMHWYDASTNTDYSPYLAGWVTPDAPAIRQLIGRTAIWMQQHPAMYPGTTGLFGYTSGSGAEQDVRNQVNAIFDTLQNVYHVHYAQDNVPYSQDASQQVRLPQDVLSSPYPTGMCVETTAILASAVESLGMRPYFVIVPGHVFLGVALGSSPYALIEYWETSDLNGGVSGTAANVHGDDEYGRFQLAKKILRVIDVQFERGRGIEPIA